MQLAARQAICRDAIGVDQAQKIDRSVSNNGKSSKPVASHPAVVSPRAGTKQALVVEMLSKERGATLDSLIEATKTLPGVELVLDGVSAAKRFEMPLDREGDFIAISRGNTVIGATRAEHDLASLAGHRLRSHGGISEQVVPFILSRPPNPKYWSIAETRRLRNFDMFDFVLNSGSV